MIKKEVKVFNSGNQELPKYETELAAGFDFRSDFSKINSVNDFLGDKETFIYNTETKTVTLFGNGGRILIPTGIHIGLPDGYELQVRPRSGLALKHGITVLNSPGTIDADYKGMISIILCNFGNKSFEIKEGDRIAQGVLKQVEQTEWMNVNTIEELGNNKRNNNGFGTTGVK